MWTLPATILRDIVEEFVGEKETLWSRAAQGEREEGRESGDNEELEGEIHQRRGKEKVDDGEENVKIPANRAGCCKRWNRPADGYL